MGVVWVVLRGWGVVARGRDLRHRPVRVIATLGRFALPLFALILIAITGGLTARTRGARSSR